MNNHEVDVDSECIVDVHSIVNLNGNSEFAVTVDVPIVLMLMIWILLV